MKQIQLTSLNNGHLESHVEVEVKKHPRNPNRRAPNHQLTTWKFIQSETFEEKTQKKKIKSS